MIIERVPLQGAAIIHAEPYTDQRGVFARFFCEKELRDILGERRIVNVNFSRTTEKGAIRGLHFQYPPMAEMKFIRCIKGSVFDVIVDVRANSPMFLQWYGLILSDENQKMICIPEGCAHGFQVLEDNSELLYLHTAPYSPEYEGALSVFDPRIGVEWPLPAGQISERDQNHPFITEQFQGVIL